MGIFNKKRTFVGSTSMKLMADTPDVAVNSVVSSVLKKTNIAQDLIINMLDGPAIKVRTGVRWAKDNYYLGLPQGDLQYGGGADALVVPILQDLFGNRVSIIYNVVDVADPLLLATEHLIKTRLWSAEDNIVTVPYITPPAGSSAVTLGDVEFTEVTDEIKITYHYTDVGSVPQTQVELITIAGLDNDATYYHVAYVPLAQDGSPLDNAINYWHYAVSSGTYPQLDTLPPVPESPYYPIIPLRRHNVDIMRDTNSATQEYITTEKLCKKLGLNALHLAEGINANPDIGDIDHAFVYYGVDISTQTNVGIKYLYEFFTHMGGLEFTDKATYDTWFAGSHAVPPPLNRLKIQDSAFNLDIGYLYADTQVVVGNLGKIGTCTSTYNGLAPIDHYDDVHVFTEEIDEMRRQLIYSVEASEMIFRKQITLTSYSETTVKGLIHVNHIYKHHTVDTTLANAQDPDNFGFMIPLNRFVVSGMSLKDENALMYEACAIMFNSYQTVKTKWYQTGFFKFVMITIAVVSTVMSFGTTSSFYAWAANITGLAGVALTVAMIGITAAISVVVSALFKVLVKAIGMENAFYAAILMAVAAIAAPGTGVKWLPGATTAQQLLMGSQAILSGVSANVEEAMGDLIDDKADFEDYAADETARLETANDLLGLSGILSPWDFLATMPQFIDGETPDDFYTRTIHSGNIGLAAIDMTHSYVDLQLQLPRTTGA